VEKRFTVVSLLLLALTTALGAQQTLPWTKAELASIRDLWIGALEKPAPDPSNTACDSPLAARLGHNLFFDTRFSLNGAVACATCHKPELGFQDGLPRGKGIGTTNRRTMPIPGTAYSPWLFWDGRKDSQWAQALGPMESAVEHGGNRTMYAHLVARYYKAEYEAVFGSIPDLGDSRRFPASAGPVEDPQARSAWEAMAQDDRDQVTRIYANMGKAIAAYERKLLPGPSRFDSFAEALGQGRGTTAGSRLTPDEQAGLKLFVGKGECIKCHNGPLFTNNDFHNPGVPAVPGLPEDLGRALGAPQVLRDEFNCLSPLSDAAPADCAELKFLKSEGDELTRAYKPPSLRNVAERPPYMHAGQFASLGDVLRHYNRAPKAPSGHTELKPLNLSVRELAQLESFLRALSGPLDAPEEFLRKPLLRADQTR
jgi:cytochrome c peroxidase